MITFTLGPSDMGQNASPHYDNVDLTLYDSPVTRKTSCEAVEPAEVHILDGISHQNSLWKGLSVGARERGIHGKTKNPLKHSSLKGALCMACTTSRHCIEMIQACPAMSRSCVVLHLPSRWSFRCCSGRDGDRLTQAVRGIFRLIK